MNINDNKGIGHNTKKVKRDVQASCLLCKVHHSPGGHEH